MHLRAVSHGAINSSSKQKLVDVGVTTYCNIY